MDALDNIPTINAIINGKYSFMEQAEVKADEMIARMALKERFKVCFPASREDDDG